MLATSYNDSNDLNGERETLPCVEGGTRRSSCPPCNLNGDSMSLPSTGSHCVLAPHLRRGGGLLRGGGDQSSDQGLTSLLSS